MKHSLLSIDSDPYVKSLAFYKFIFTNSELNLSKIQLGFPIFVYAITILFSKLKTLESVLTLPSLFLLQAYQCYL